MSSSELLKTTQHLQLETLLKRLPQENIHYQEIKEQFLKHTAGHFGETTTDYYLQYLNKDAYQIIQDVRLFDGIQTFQIDSLVLSEAFLLILEVKNYRGKLIFDLDHQQMFREYNGVKDMFPDPFLQVEHQKRQLNRWLSLFGYPEIPIYSLIVVANSKTTIKTHGKASSFLKRRIVRPKLLPSRIEEITRHYREAFMDQREIRLLANHIKKEYTPYKASLMDQFDLTMDDLIFGVPCPKCSILGMERKRDHWLCLKCGEKSREAHTRALKDFALLISKEITNSVFRKFANISSK